jgi:hypothetical protein
VDSRNTRAQWADDVPDLYGESLAKAGDYLTVAQVSNLTSLSPNTLRDALSRPPVTRENNPMFALSRPAARIANQPLYSHDQVEQAIAIQKSSGHRHLGGGEEALPGVTPEEAKRAGLVSIVEFKDFAGVHEQTVRRWAREQASFPSPVALRSRSGGEDDDVKVHPGVPIVMYELDAAKEWLRNYIETGRGKRVERIAEHMRSEHGWKVKAGSALEKVTA